ncbi:aldehyde dehydrogenase [Lampropedia aestuarii]|uniref:Aldehyde dehydrogenase n=1 Tax=Lampropedia aestuarii TaxID=2562762 RepID=A0A4S5BGG7_9BURK|nr:aldehyde dehydrogenase family protein [Lampropedia aestuarii]MDH5858300.1 aldehyde dehydrogenase [Lampropedia aestuarii]THJ31447.1 aldehyde dehydrogenase [Lampropedia aestuarii]
MADPFELKRFNLDLAFPFKNQYGNYIGGQWVAPSAGRYFDNLSPITGKPFTKIPQSDAEDVNRALDAAHAAQVKWGKTSAADRSNLLLKIADRIEQNLQTLAVAETIDNGKPLRETMAADLPLAVDHFRYFAGCLRAEEGAISEIDEYTVAYHFQEPIGVVGQIIPWNFPLLMAAWKLAPALAAGCSVVMKPAEQTPASILVLMEIIGDLIPPGVVNIVNGFGKEAGEALATSKRIAKIAFTGSTPVGQRILHAAADNLIPSTVELGGKSPNIFFADVMDHDDAFFDKALEGLAMFALNQGEVCTCPSRILVQESIAEAFIERAKSRVEQMKLGHPLDTSTMVGAQVSQLQMDKILSYIDIGKKEGARALIGGERNNLGQELNGGFYIKPTILQGDNKMRIFQEEIFGPVAALTTFKDMDEAIAIANDTEYGLGAGVWSRNGTIAYQMGRALQAGRVWTNCYHAYPAHATFGGYKKSGIGRETHKMALGNYQQTKCMLVSYNANKLGFF